MQQSKVQQLNVKLDIPKTLNLDAKLLDNYNATKTAYKLSLQKQQNFTNRAQIHLAYEILCNSNLKKKLNEGQADFILTESDPELLDAYIIFGESEKFANFLLIQKDLNVFYMKDCMQRSLLYKAVKYESYDLAVDLISVGLDVNEKQINGSTALHCASFYSRHDMIKLLLVAGADVQIKNDSGKTCQEEQMKDEQVNQILKTQSPILDFLCSMRRQFKNMKLSVSRSLTNEIISVYLENPFNRPRKDEDIETAFFHGTKLQFVKSIFQTGLKKPGELDAQGEKIERPGFHIKSGIKFKGIKNFAKATFLSKSPFYASNEAYSESVSLFEEPMKVLIHCIVDDEYLTEHSGTLWGYEPKIDETEKVEARVEDSQQITVLGVYFVQEKTIEQLESVEQFKKILQRQDTAVSEVFSARQQEEG